jgi:hypothetical protein
MMLHNIKVAYYIITVRIEFKLSLIKNSLSSVNIHLILKIKTVTYHKFLFSKFKTRVFLVG